MYSDKTFLSDSAKVEEMVQFNSEFLALKRSTYVICLIIKKLKP